MNDIYCLVPAAVGHMPYPIFFPVLVLSRDIGSLTRFPCTLCALGELEIGYLWLVHTAHGRTDIIYGITCTTMRENNFAGLSFLALGQSPIISKWWSGLVCISNISSFSLLKLNELHQKKQKHTHTRSLHCCAVMLRRKMNSCARAMWHNNRIGQQ